MYWQDDRGQDLFLRSGCQGRKMLDVIITFFLIDVNIKVCHVIGILGGGFKPPPQILKALQNHAKLNLIVKTVKNC